MSDAATPRHSDENKTFADLPTEHVRAYFFGCRQLLDAAVMAGVPHDAAAAEAFSASVTAGEWALAQQAWDDLNLGPALGG